MFRTELSVCLSLLISILCWLGASSPAWAQPWHYNIAQASPNTSLVAIFSGGRSLFSFSGKKPTNLGVHQGKLLDCPGTPNCVNSQSANSEFKVEPLTYQSDPAQALTNLKSVIQAMPRTKLVNETSNYLSAEFSSALMGFVDDVEFYLDETEGVIQVRSASRLGKSDLGVNRKRVEEIRAKFAQLETKV
jgi:uncharacterized protein (DUF1499 family)